MNTNYKYLASAICVIICMSFFSCNTYEWQRKRYYKADKTKNWNTYNKTKAEEEDKKAIEKYYKK